MRSLSRALLITLLSGLTGSAIAISSAQSQDGPGFAAATAANRTLCVHDVAAGQTLTMRAEANGNATTVAELPAGTCGLRLVGKCEGDWCEMGLGSQHGWVPWRFVGIYELPSASQSVTAKPEPPRAAAASPQPVPSGAQRSAASPQPSPPSQLHRQTLAAKAGPTHKSPVPKRTAAARAPQRPASRPAYASSRPPYAAGAPAGPWGGGGLLARTWSSFASGGRCVVRVAWWDRLNVRAGPGIDHDAIGGIPPGVCGVSRSGGCERDWCRVAWRGRTGWVNTFYLE